jgi:hypothetical protein
MTASPAPSGSRSARILFWIGWGVLAFITVGLTLNHAYLVLTYTGAPAGRLLFPVLVALGVYAVVVLAIPYRRLAWWAWAVTWVFILTTAVMGLFLEADVGVFYVGAAVVSAIAQVLVLPRFRRGLA